MRNKISLIFITAAIITGCTTIKTISLSNYSVQISYLENSAKFYPDNKLKACKLSEIVNLNGHNCISWIHFFENGLIKQFQTSEDIILPNYIIPSGSVIFYNIQSPDKIKYIYFSKDIVIDSIKCKSGGKISTEFYENGKLNACFLTENQNIQGFPCMSSVFEPVYFYPDGKIKLLTLSANSEYMGTIFKKGQSIIIDEQGTISRFKR
jgi:hypothetical protein